MALLTSSRHDALVAALQAVRDARPGNTDEAYDLFATQVLQTIPAFTKGADAPTEPIPAVSVAGDLYYDTANGKYYLYNGTAWKLITSAA